MRKESIEVEQKDYNFSKRKRMKSGWENVIFSDKLWSVFSKKQKKWKLVKLISDNLNVNFESLQEYLISVQNSKK